MTEPRSRNDVSIIIAKDAADEYRWTMIHRSNGKIVGASTEGYSRRIDCVDNLYLVTGWYEDG